MLHGKTHGAGEIVLLWFSFFIGIKEFGEKKFLKCESFDHSNAIEILVKFLIEMSLHNCSAKIFLKPLSLVTKSFSIPLQYMGIPNCHSIQLPHFTVKN